MQRRRGNRRGVQAVVKIPQTLNLNPLNSWGWGIRASLILRKEGGALMQIYFVLMVLLSVYMLSREQLGLMENFNLGPSSKACTQVSQNSLQCCMRKHWLCASITSSPISVCILGFLSGLGKNTSAIHSSDEIIHGVGSAWNRSLQGQQPCCSVRGQKSIIQQNKLVIHFWGCSMFVCSFVCVIHGKKMT